MCLACEPLDKGLNICPILDAFFSNGFSFLELRFVMPSSIPSHRGPHQDVDITMLAELNSQEGARQLAKRRWHHLNGWKIQREHRPIIGLAVEGHTPVVSFHDRLYHRETQTQTVFRTALVRTVETFPHLI